MGSQKTTDESCFISVAGMNRVYDPACNRRKQPQKHPCKDCHFCQFCSDARCQSCRTGTDQVNDVSSEKLSFREQILLYERINAQSKKKKQSHIHTGEASPGKPTNCCKD